MTVAGHENSVPSERLHSAVRVVAATNWQPARRRMRSIGALRWTSVCKSANAITRSAGALFAVMGPIVRGALLGILNIVLIALGIAVREHAGVAGFFAMAILGSFPALLAGVGIGAIAQKTPRWPVTARLTVIIVPALFVVVFFGAAARFDAYVLLAFMPTIAAALYLERSTRAAELIPAAQTTGHRLQRVARFQRRGG